MYHESDHSVVDLRNGMTVIIRMVPPAALKNLCKARELWNTANPLMALPFPQAEPNGKNSFTVSFEDLKPDTIRAFEPLAQA